MAKQVTLYTDGAARGNPGNGGYGLILIYGAHKKEFSEGFRLTTNNRMELLSVIIGLEMLKEPCEVNVYSDSKYVVDAVEKGWVFNWSKKNFKQKKNKDLWERFLSIFSKHKVRFFWIKGHNGHPENERCDALAVKAAESKVLKIDTWYEQNQSKK